MSADNGIYILKTPRHEDKHEQILDGNIFEYRVAHAQAIENIYWEYEDGNPEEIIIYFGGCEIMKEKEAHEEAFRLEHKIISDPICPILEYGISTIELPHSFKYYQEIFGKLPKCSKCNHSFSLCYC